MQMGLLCRYSVCSGRDPDSHCPRSGRDPGSRCAHSGRDPGSRMVSVLSPQVPGVKLEKLCPYLVPQEHKDFQGPRVSKDPKVLSVFSFAWRQLGHCLVLLTLTLGLAHNR